MPVVLPYSAAEKTWKKSRNAIDHLTKGAKIETVIAPFILRVKMITNLGFWVLRNGLSLSARCIKMEPD